MVVVVVYDGGKKEGRRGRGRSVMGVWRSKDGIKGEIGAGVSMVVDEEERKEGGHG